VKTAISIPDRLFEAAERLAERLNISRSLLFQRAMRAYLAEHGDEGVTELLNEVYRPDAEVARIDPVLDRLQHASLPEEDW